MKLIKKVSVWVLLITLLTIVVLPASAEGSASLSVTGTSAYAGDTVDVKIVMSNNPGIVSMYLKINYDKSVLTLTSVTDGGLIGAAIHSPDVSANPYPLTWQNDTVSTNYTNNGTIATLTFKVADDAAVGDYPISISYNNDDYDIYNFDFETVDFDVVSGSVSVVKRPVPATGISLPETLSLDLNASETLTATVTPDNTTDTVVWSSDNEAVATVSGGTVTGVAEGTATITATAGKVSASCTVTVACQHASKTMTPAKDSTCTVPGNEEYTTCNTCGDVSGSDAKLDLDPDNHVNTEERAEEPATCEKDGRRAGIFCLDCSKYQSGGDIIPKAHKYIEKTEVTGEIDHLKSAATCTSPAVYYKSCEFCGLNHEEDTFEYGDVLSHSYTNAADSQYLAKAADCENAAVYYMSCADCGEKHDSWTFTVGNPLDHTWVDATCTLPKTCSVCQATEGEALGHKWVDATCTTPKTCGVCDATEGEALGHKWVDATCTLPKTCSVCDATEGEALGHKWVDATCTLPKTCSVCDATEGEALGHKWVDATCTTPKTCSVCDATEGGLADHTYGDTYVKDEEGHWKACAVCGNTTASTVHTYNTDWSKGEEGHWHECSVCGYKKDLAEHNFGDEGDNCLECDYERNHVHRLIQVSAKAATCTEAGNNAYYTCSGCANLFEDAFGNTPITDKTSVVIAALNHDWAAATCTAPKTCKREGCGVTEGDTLPHTWVAATCTTAKTCSVCNTTEGNALGHTWVDATCTTPKTCSVCDATEGDPLGHTAPDEWSKNDTHHWHECPVCGENDQDRAEHDFELVGENDICKVCSFSRTHVHGEPTEVQAVAATCLEAGNKAYFICPICDKWFENRTMMTEITDHASVVIAALGHDMADATCTEPSTCKREDCGHTVGVPLGHDWNADWAKGEETHWHTCKREGCLEKNEETDHTFQLSEDKKSEICSVCAYSKDHKHTLTLMKGWDAECEKEGQKNYYYCSAYEGCDAWFEDANGSVVITDKTTVVIPALEHDMAPATCTKPSTCKLCGKEDDNAPALGHKWDTETWTTSSAYHWHECTACTELTDHSQKGDYGAHADGDDNGLCDTCRYVMSLNSTSVKIQNESLDASSVTPALENAGYDSVGEIKEALTNVVVDKGGSSANIQLHDVVMYIDDGSGWVEATEENFPKGGITVRLPYPEGTTKGTHDFVVAHMFSKGDRAGQIEYPTVYEGDDGIYVTLNGLSPVAVSWTTTRVYDSDSPKTGDTTNTGLWLTLVLFGAMGTAASVVGKKHSRKRK